MKISSRPFGLIENREPVRCYKMEHESGIEVEVLNYGATLRSVKIPVHGKRVQVCRGYETLEEYLAGTAYVGAVVGRCAGRIENAAFRLNGKEHRLSANEAPNHLHGGTCGFDRKIWNAEVLSNGIRFSRVSADGEEGYPGEVDITVDYTINEDGVLCLSFDVLAKADTVVSMTHHGYWNLEGESSESAAEHLFCTPAAKFAEIRADGITTGKLLDTAGTPFDFSVPQALGSRWELPSDQLKAASGFDHTFLVEGVGLRPLCSLQCPANGLRLEVSGTLPGIHLYTANFFEPIPRSCAALEAQFVPNSPNRPEFPSVEVKKDSHWKQEIRYRFVKE